VLGEAQTDRRGVECVIQVQSHIPRNKHTHNTHIALTVHNTPQENTTHKFGIAGEAGQDTATKPQISSAHAGEYCPGTCSTVVLTSVHSCIAVSARFGSLEAPGVHECRKGKRCARPLKKATPRAELPSCKDVAI